MPIPDSITITTDTGTRTMDVEEFLSLPLSERINHVLSKTARFYVRGEEIDGKEALAAVRARKAAEVAEATEAAEAAEATEDES